MPPDVVDILVVNGGEPCVSARLCDLLGESGARVRIVTGLASVLRIAKTRTPRAVIIDMTLPTQGMGADHVVRILRQTHPLLPIVAHCATVNRRIESIASEFSIPLLVSPFGAEELLAALRQCGACPALPDPTHLAASEIVVL
jgi:DNA-binding response OmpR family regulator